MSGQVLLQAQCAMCGAVHDVWGAELPDGDYKVEARDLECPSCDCPIAAEVRPREGLA